MGLVQRWRACNPGATLRHIAWWKLLRFLTWLYVKLFYRHRTTHADRIPAAGGVLLISNHQSFLDLIVVGVGIHHRHFHSMARKTLFDSRAMAWLIRSLNGFAVDQSKGDLGAMRTAIAKLKEGHLLLVFPEGSRTPDGAVAPFRAGIMTIIKRARPMVVPAAVEGVYDVWPIGAKRPRLHGRTAATYGEPIAADELLAMDPRDALELLRSRVDELRAGLHDEMRRRTHGRYPTNGDGEGSAEAAAP